jgi:hypothetical protein
MQWIEEFPVRAFCHADDEGRFILDGVREGEVVISAARPGISPAEVVRLSIPAVPRIDIVLPPSTVLRGRVVIAKTGRPLGGAVVTATTSGITIQSQRGRATTGPDGRYEIIGLRPESLHMLAAQGEGYLSFDRIRGFGATLVEGTPLVLDITVHRAARVEGTVRGPAGPVPNARVHIDDETHRFIFRQTGPDGRFQADFFPGQCEVEVEADGYLGKGVEFKAEAGELKTIDLVLDPKPPVPGDVADRDAKSEQRRIRIYGVIPGAPPGTLVEDVSVSEPIAVDVPLPREPWGTTIATVSEDGSWSLDIVHRRHRMAVRLLAPGFAPGRPATVEVRPGRDEHHVELRLDRGHTLTARVIDKETGEPVAAAGAGLVTPAHVELIHPYFFDTPPPRAVHGVSDETGRLVIEHVPEGTWQLRVRGPGRLPVQMEITVPAAGEILVRLARARVFGGTVRCRDGSIPVRRYLVVAKKPGGPGVTWGPLRPDGNFLLRGVPPGRFMIVVRRPGTPGYPLSGEAFGPFESGRRDLELVVR